MYESASSLTSESRPALAAIMLFAAAGSLSLGLAPFIVHALTEHAGLSNAQAGMCVSTEMAGNALAAAAVLFLLRRIPRRRLAVIALLVVMAGNLACLAASSYLTFACARFVAGLGCGLTTAAFGMLAVTGMPTRNFAVYSVSAVALVAICGAGAPWLLGLAGASALFVMIALVASLALVAARWLPERAAMLAVTPTGAAYPRFQSSAAAILGSLMTLLYFTSLGAFWAYVATLGAIYGDSPDVISTSISLGFLVCGISGSMLASFLAERVNHRLVISICAFGTAAAIVMVIAVPGSKSFAMAVPLFILAWFIIYPFLMGLLSEIDPSGRLAMFGVLIQMMAFVIGPALAGRLMDQHRYIAFGVACSSGIAVSLICALAIAPPRRLARGASSDG